MCVTHDDTIVWFFKSDNKQLPEALAEKQREIRQTIKEIRKKEEELPNDAKT